MTRRFLGRTGWRSLWRLGAIVLPAFHCHGQENTRYVYVAQVVGDWVLRAQGEKGGVPLRPLTRIPVTAQIGVAPGAVADTSHVLVLRDPRSLRTATVRCVPVARCRAERRVSDLSFGGSAATASARTGALFVHLEGGPEQRSRVKLVGARGASQDWGILVLTWDSLTLDVRPLVARIDADQATFVARVCPLTSATSAAPACLDERAIRPDDCALTSRARCAFPALDPANVAVAVEVFERKGTELATDPVARAFAIITREPDRRQLTALADAYWKELEALRGDVSPEEFDALTAAAVWEAARTPR